VSAFDALFVPDDLREAVSGRSWLEAMLGAEHALANAGAIAGIVPEEAAAKIAEECSSEAYDWDVLLLEWRLSGSPAEPLVRALVRRVGEDAGKWVHLGATSQDIVDTAAMLVSRRALGLVVDRLTLAADACAGLARTHRDTPMAGRTLLQQAVPTTFGLKAAGWLVALGDVRARLVELRQTLPAQLGGAAGTLSALGEHGLEVAALYARELDLAEPTLPWHANRTRIVELGAALTIAAGVIAKIGVDLQLLAQTEVAEVRESGDSGGSSAMPQKRNPVGATWARAAAELARGHASVLIGAPAAEHERGAGAWQAECDALSGALMTTGGAAAALAGALEGLEVDRDRMRANLELTGGAIVAERCAIVLGEQLGRSQARALVRSASLRAAETGGTLRDAVAGESGLSAAELDAVFDPAGYLGSAGALVDRAVARYDAEREAR
jgi:3-carboxy-cis,cis-muconate cycloisomerase